MLNVNVIGCKADRSANKSVKANSSCRVGGMDVSVVIMRTSRKL